MFNKNTALLLFALLFILILLLVLFFTKSVPNKATPSPAPIPIFQNSPIPGLEVSQKIQLQRQTQADINYTTLQDKVLKEYPWYNNLPLQTKEYFVLFDLQKKAIRAKLYPKKSSVVSIDDQVKSSQQEITEKLKQLGVDTKKYPIEWSINPE